MTPNEKSKELVYKFYKDARVGGLLKKIDKSLIVTENSIQCALICVDEIIDVLPNTHFTEVLEQREEYWKEVKEQLKLL